MSEGHVVFGRSRRTPERHSSCPPLQLRPAKQQRDSAQLSMPGAASRRVNSVGPDAIRPYTPGDSQDRVLAFASEGPVWNSIMTLLTIRIEGGLLSPDFLETIHDQPGQKPSDFGLDARRSLVDEVTAVWSDVRAYWEAFERRRARAKDGESLTSATREAWIIPLLEALGYRLTFQRRAVEADGRWPQLRHLAPRHISLSLAGRGPG